jgi:thiol-disulfide isomerase/thioredoxin
MSANPGDAAPPFDLALPGGGFRSLADILEPGGGILVFFKSDCETSRLIVPRLGPLARALEAEGMLFLAVAQEGEDEALGFQSELGVPGTLAWEGAPYPVSTQYDVRSVPTLFVIDGAGVIAERLEGFVKREYLALGAAVEQALALGDVPPVLERPEELPERKPG